MAHYCKTCKSSSRDILQQAVKFFGSGGLGMQLKEESKVEGGHCVCFKSDTGHIFLKASDKGKESEIEVENCNCDEQVKQFLEKVS